MIKVTKRMAKIAGGIAVVLGVGILYFFTNYEIVYPAAAEKTGDTAAGNDAAAKAKTDSVSSGSILDLKNIKNIQVVKKAPDLTAEEAANKAIDYANKNMLSSGSKATLVSVKEENGLYAFKLNVDGQEYESYVSKNGKMMFVQGVKIDDEAATGAAASGSSEPSKPVEVAKSDRPDVKLFVMAYCPYGLQAEKMYLPVYNLLKDKADMGIYFVNYAMHGKAEVDENLRQYCIQKEQTAKYADYLICFVADQAYSACQSSGGENCAADFDKCLTLAGVDKGKLATCTAAADTQFKVTADYNDKASWLSGQFPKFEVNDDLNVKYAVEGSPTVVINDAQADVSPRTPEQFKLTVCGAFNTQPAECSTVLSTEAPASGFTTGTAAAGTTGGGCGN